MKGLYSSLIFIGLGFQFPVGSSIDYITISGDSIVRKGWVNLVIAIHSALIGKTSVLIIRHKERHLDEQIEGVFPA